jgi:uncharacterized protein (UPF0147 family)
MRKTDDSEVGSSQRPDMKREILQVIQLMKKNNVHPDQVKSTIKHILDVKENVGETFTDLAAKRRNGIMVLEDTANDSNKIDKNE